MRHFLLVAFLTFAMPGSALADTVKGYVDRVAILSGAPTKLSVGLRTSSKKGSSALAVCGVQGLLDAHIPTSLGLAPTSPMESLLLAAMVATREVRIATTYNGTYCELTRVEFGRFPPASQYLDPSWTYGVDITKHVESLSASRTGISLVLERHACGLSGDIYVRWSDTPGDFALLMAAFFGGRKLHAVMTPSPLLVAPCTISLLELQ